jgi:hypothetical protein
VIRYRFNRRHGWVTVGLPLLTRSQVRRFGLIASGPFSVNVKFAPKAHKPLNISGLPHFICLWLDHSGIVCVPNKDWRWYFKEIIANSLPFRKPAPEGAKEN